MWILMNSWWWPKAASDLLTKLRENLPLTIATTIVMSLLIAFWRTFLVFIKRRLGLAEAQKEPLQPYMPEGDIAHTFAADKFRHGFTIGWGWKGALVDAGVVQQELEPRKYHRRAVARMISKMALSENARVIAWRDKEFPVNIYLEDLFARDHQPMRMEVQAIFSIEPARLMLTSLEELTQPADKISANLGQKISMQAQQWVATMTAEEFYKSNHDLSERASLANGWIRNALAQSAFRIVRVTRLHVFSPALDQVYKDYGELAEENEAARREVERNKVRGALRQAVLAGRLQEIRDQKEHEEAIRIIEQESALKQKALNQELEQTEMSALEARLQIWRRKNDILLQLVDPPTGAGNRDVAQRMADNFRQKAVDAADSPFSAHEREHIRTLLKSYEGKTVKPEDILTAAARGTDIPCSVFDPLARLRGPHTLRVGDGWKFFDGGNLWQVRLTRIETRRHGFLWLRESPSKAQFELRAAPDQRRFEQGVALGPPFRLMAGANVIPVEYLEGTSSRISVRIPEAETLVHDTIAARKEVSASAGQH